jgi:hypothetical protein
MKELSEDIRRWFKEKWTAQDGSPCGSYKGRGRVKCRPSKRVSGKTAQTWGEMSKHEKKKAVRLKQRAHKKGHQFSSHKSGKTWKGHKYSPKKKLREGVEVDRGFLKTFMLDAIKNPRKFYALLTLSGMKASEATRILYNLKHPRLTSSSFETKMRMLGLLQNIIELITHDRILYSRLRALANSGELEHLGKDIVSTSSYRQKIRSKKLDFSEEGMSVGAGQIAGMPTADTEPPVHPYLMKLRSILMRRKKPKGGSSPNPVLFN